MKELGPRIRIRIRSERRLKTFTDLTRTSSRHRQERPGRVELAARRERVGVGVWLQVGAPARRLRGFAEPGGGSASYPEREGACRLRLRAAVWTPWVLGWGAQATVNMDSAAGACLRMLFLLSAKPWSTLAAGNTCEYSKSFKTYTGN